MIIPRDVAGFSLQSCTDPVIALASLLTSEAPSYAKYPQYSVAIGGAVVNAANAIIHEGESLNRAILRRIVGSSFASDNPKNGKLGPQSGRWASTRQDPIAGHLELAKQILKDPSWYATKARGATQWVDQKTQVAMHAKKPATNPDIEPLMRRRYSQGAHWVGPIEGIDPYVLTLLGPVGVPLDEALAMLADGRARWKQTA